MTAKISQPIAYVGALIALSDADWEAIEAAGSVRLDAISRRRLTELIVGYTEASLLNKTAVRPGRVRKRLAPLTKAAKRLVAAIDQLGPYANHSPAGRWLRQRNLARRRDPPHLEDLRATVAALVADAEAAVAELPHDMGAASDPYDDRLILDALAVFNDVGGKGRQSSSAQRFLVEICKLAGAKRRSTDALKQKTKLLKHRRR